MSHASSRSIANATSPRAETAGATACPSRVQHRGAARAVERDREQPAVGGGDHDFVVARPAPTAADAAVGGDDHGRRRAVGRGHDEVGAAVEAVGPGRAGRRRATTADRPTPCERATMAAVIAGPVTPAVTLPTLARATSATRLGPGR